MRYEICILYSVHIFVLYFVSRVVDEVEIGVCHLCVCVFVCVFCFKAVEGVVILPENEDYSKLGVKSKELHFVTAGSKGRKPSSSRKF